VIARVSGLVAVPPFGCGRLRMAGFATGMRRASDHGDVMTVLYRAMIEARDGRPEIGRSARTLGVRISGKHIDILVEPSGEVLPGTGGMSVAPDTPDNLPPHRRARDPAWTFEARALGPDLLYRPDPLKPNKHGTIEPAQPMPLDQYDAALEATRAHWNQVPAPVSFIWRTPIVIEPIRPPIPEQFLSALDAPNRVDALADAVEGVAATLPADRRTAMYRALDALRARLHEQDDPREDDVLDVMDFVWGFCSDHARLSL